MITQEKSWGGKTSAVVMAANKPRPMPRTDCKSCLTVGPGRCGLCVNAPSGTTHRNSMTISKNTPMSPPTTPLATSIMPAAKSTRIIDQNLRFSTGHPIVDLIVGMGRFQLHPKSPLSRKPSISRSLYPISARTSREWAPSFTPLCLYSG